ncbi:GNAT family N-acetyltransferase [Niveibacterium terrae]|uniref:GNAT family N-acetyltransferase n=1 Tax=Niveibacterium terrae TaxID=3373598 RepID=UPI003A9583D0
MSAYVVRQITEDDIVGFHAAVESVALERLYLSAFEAFPFDGTVAYVREAIEQGYPQLVAVADGRVVGWCDILPEGRPLYAHVGVMGLGVLAEYRGGGIGHALITAAIAAARTRGFERVELQARASNARALHLYEKFGFVREGLKRRAARDGDRYDDIVCMGRVFSIDG